MAQKEFLRRIKSRKAKLLFFAEKTRAQAHLQSLFMHLKHRLKNTQLELLMLVFVSGLKDYCFIKTL